MGGWSHADENHDFFVPPEEDPHDLTFMQWPVSRKVYHDAEFLEITQETIADIANTIVEFEPVIMLACLLYTSPSPRDKRQSRMPSSA